MSEQSGPVTEVGADGARRDELAGRRGAEPKRTRDTASRIFTTSVASVYPLYVAKAERKGRSRNEVDAIMCWLTGFDAKELARHLADETTFQDFFAEASLNPNVRLITGVVCGVRVEEVEDPLMRRIRYLDKLVDELAKGKPMDKILRR